MLTYLDFIEEYKKETSINLFEKVLIASDRAKDIYFGKTPCIKEEEYKGHKPISIALYETLNNYVEPKILTKEKYEASLQDEEEEVDEIIE